MKKFFLGRSPLTTITGVLVAILTGVSQAAASGSHHWQDVLLPAALALFGRFAGDDGSGSNHNPPTSPLPVPPKPYTAPLIGQERFLRRGREYKQRRGLNGRFTTALAPVN